MYDQRDVLTLNERAWLRFLRDVSNGSDPEPTLRRVQLLRRIRELSESLMKMHGVTAVRNG